ncbi:unnamed protein product [Arabidopsis halleri]
MQLCYLLTPLLRLRCFSLYALTGFAVTTNGSSSLSMSKRVNNNYVSTRINGVSKEIKRVRA